jgi:hypothetical protein
MIRSRMGRDRPPIKQGGFRRQAILLGAHSKGIAGKALGEVLVHADTLRRILPRLGAWTSQVHSTTGCSPEDCIPPPSLLYP